MAATRPMLHAAVVWSRHVVHAARRLSGRASALLLAVSFACAPKQTAREGELQVMISGGLTAAYRELTPQLELATGRHLATAFGASMGTAPDAIPVRLARGEAADVVIMVDYSLDELADRGIVDPHSRIDLARSMIGVAVRAGALKPDIRSAEALTKALLEAKSIAYSASASGRYVSTKLFTRLGIAEAVAAKSTEIRSERVGVVVARGDAEIGFQQMSELLPIEGIEILGPLPPSLQHITTYAGGVVASTDDPEAARALIEYLASPAAATAIAASGLEPIVAMPAR